MTRLAFADPLRATSICNNYNHVVEILLLRFSEVSRLAGRLVWRKSYVLWRILNGLWRILIGNVEGYGGNRFLLAVSKQLRTALILCANGANRGVRAAPGSSSTADGSKGRPQHRTLVARGYSRQNSTRIIDIADLLRSSLNLQHI